MHIIAAAAPTFEKAGLKAPAVAAAVKAMMGRQQVQQRQQGSTGEEGVVVAPAHLDRLPPKASTLLFSLLPTSALLALRCCSKVHYARFHAPGAPHWDDVSQRLVVELHASRFHLATASEIVGPPPSVHTGARDAGGGGEGGDGDDDGVMMEVAPPPPKRLGSRPLVVGHRGASGHKPGNSLESFHHAVALGADMIELDVCLDSACQVVVHHDPYFKSSGQLLSTLSLPEIKRLAPEVEPLSVVLRELQSSGASLYLDIKTDRVVPPLMRVLHEAIASGGWAPSRLLIASFNQHHIGIEVNAHRLAFPQTLGSVQTCIIVDGVPISFAKQYQQLGVSWCSIGDGCVLPSFVEDAHSRGIGVMVWTVNNATMMKNYLELGVDAVVTDFPERAVAARALLAMEKQSPSQQMPPSSSPQGSPKRPREGVAGRRGNGDNSSPFVSAYPAALHQPRKRLVAALSQAWPLLRALEGRRPHASHTPPTPTATHARRQQLLASSSASFSSPSTDPQTPPASARGVVAICGGLVAHLKAAAQAAEEVATAVLQPRLRPRLRRGGARTAMVEGEVKPQTPPRAAEEGGGGGEKGGASSVPTACGLTAHPASSDSSSSSSSSHRVGGSEEEQVEQEEEHDGPFLPFERKWAAQAASCS